MPKRESSKDRDVYIRFFPTDWRGDENLAMCSLAARGLWIELICLAHRHEGYVLIAGRVPTEKELAKACRCSQVSLRRHLDELRRHEVCRMDEDRRALYSLRMVRDAKRRKVNQENGQNGGNPALSDNRNRGSRITDSDKPHSPESIFQSQEDQDLSTAQGMALVFPTESDKPYRLAEAKVGTWQAAYPKLDVIGECRRALVWLESHPGRLKTHGGMERFLVGWLNKAQRDLAAAPNAKPVYRPAQMAEVDHDWFEECKRVHGGTCELNRHLHGQKMESERLKAEAS